MTERLHQLANKPGKETKVEDAKKASGFLRGGIAATLADPAAEFSGDDQNLLKFHGIYQQEDRDSRAAAKVTGETVPAWFMTRIKVPGGVLTADQYLAMDQIADDVTYNQSLRVTTRQNFQLHGILKTSLKQAIQRINQCLLSTLCGCGDVERNIMAPPAPLARPGHRAARAMAQTLSDAMCPRTNAYAEIWLDGEKIDSSADAEPLYGKQYLPRKFKTGIAVPEDNSIDAHSQDTAFIAIVEGDDFRGANVLVGGGLGLTHKMERTYARLGTPLGYVDKDNIVAALQIIVAMFRDYGDRTDRKHARLKYIVEEFGIDAFRDEFQRRADFELKPWVETAPLQHQDWLGKHEQGDGKLIYGVYIPNGRIIDNDLRRTKTALRKIVQTLRCEVILTPNQNILFANLDEEQVKQIARLLDAYCVPRAEQLTATRRHSMACPALPTCGLALTESERAMPDVIEAFEQEFTRLGVDDAPVTIRMTGCPNGCARPYTADIGLVGHKPGHYDLFLGGRIEGDRMAELFAENVPTANLVATLRPLLEAWSRRREPEEGFGDFYNRVVAGGVGRHIVTGAKDHPTIEKAEKALMSLPVL